MFCIIIIALGAISVMKTLAKISLYYSINPLILIVPSSFSIDLFSTYIRKNMIIHKKITTFYRKISLVTEVFSPVIGIDSIHLPKLQGNNLSNLSSELSSIVSKADK